MRKRWVKVIAIVLSLMIGGLAVACGGPASAPALTPVTTPESASTIAELEAKITQLEAENQQLNAVLQDIYSLVTSSSYTNTLTKLNEVQNKSSELAYFAEGLPDLPPLPLGITVSQINNAIEKAQYLRQILKVLPPPPPLLAPSWWTDLDNMKNEFITMTEWMEDLRDLPEFLSSAESLEDLRSQYETYLSDVQSTTSDAGSLLQQVRDTASGY